LSGFDELPMGSYEDGLAMVGYTQERRVGEAPVSEGTVKLFSAMLRDGNASYWDREFAEQRWGAQVAPPALLHTWVLPLTWRPQGADDRIALCARIPLPGSSLINVGTDVTYHRHVRVGDVISVVETVTGISELKRSRVGEGYFVTTTAVYTDQHDETIAEYVNVLFRYEPAPTPASEAQAAEAQVSA
jgi:acyl dehydratase